MVKVKANEDKLSEYVLSLKGKSGIYKIANLLNEKFYVGSAIDFYDRWYSHKSRLNRNKHDNNHLQNAWNKYGEDNFTFDVIEIIDDKNRLFDCEQYWIDTLYVLDKNIGYNINPKASGRRGAKLTDKQKENLSNIVKEYHKNLTDEEKINLYKDRGRQISKGKLSKEHKMSEESKKKMSDAKKGIKLGERPQEIKDKISKSKMGHKNTPLGSAHPNSKYTEEIVIKIKLMLSNGLSVKEISNILSVKQSAIYDMKSGRTWSHILPDLNLSNKNK